MDVTIVIAGDLWKITKQPPNIEEEIEYFKKKNHLYNQAVTHLD